MSTAGSSHTSRTHYCLSCLPHTVRQQDTSNLPRYRSAYTRHSSAPDLSKETIWHAISRFQQYLKDGQTTLGHCLEPSGNPTESLQRWRTEIFEKARQAEMDGRPLALGRTQWNPVIHFDCTMYKVPRKFEKSPGADEIRTEVWRLHQIQAPWSPVLASLTPSLSPLVTGIPGFTMGSRFYAAAQEVDTYRDTLKAATAASRTMQDHLSHCHNSCRHEDSAVGWMARDWLLQRLGDGPDAPALTVTLQPGVSLTAYMSLATAAVVFNLKNTHPQLNGLTYDVYTSKNTYDAGKVWMNLSVDKPSGRTGQ